MVRLRADDALAVREIASLVTRLMAEADRKNLSLLYVARKLTTSRHWGRFCVVAQSDRLPSDWLGGCMAPIVRGWAKSTAKVS